MSSIEVFIVYLVLVNGGIRLPLEAGVFCQAWSSARPRGRWTGLEFGKSQRAMDRPGVRQVPKGNGEQGKMEKTGRKIICGAPTTLAVKELMMMM